MQCGCACISCDLPGEMGKNITACNPAGAIDSVTCYEHDKSNCGPEYSSEEQIIWCAVPAPSTYPPLYDISGSIIYNYADYETQGSSEDSVDIAWAGGANETFVREAMASFVKQPSPQTALSDPAVFNGILVRTRRP